MTCSECIIQSTPAYPDSGKSGTPAYPDILSPLQQLGLKCIVLQHIRTSANREIRHIQITFLSPQQTGLSQCILLWHIRTPKNSELRHIRTHLLVPSSENHCFYSGKSGQQQKLANLAEIDSLLLHFLYLLLFF